ncbi:hypothetical protein EYZ11_009595 [Aspergillus tanneri]|uniref:RRM domain-containing protein n=1 Tax=Aspergillus tanneri TaxID=1220188 RepID=A0A4S3J7T1_9EURO|nr:hypothetical protein EYZ11_009595 [Aspergillus tanneri]
MTQVPTAKSTGGVLQIPAAATQKNSIATPKKALKPAAPRLKLLVRRLPPGLTQAEFETALGADWKTGAGKVDWFQYKPGKVSKDPAKPSRPSRAYIHVLSSDHIIALSSQVRQTSFTDARNTSNDPVLIGPPSVEYAPYAKIPGNRVRKDARQGTIDQDPEFISFLESLTQPIGKPAAVESSIDGEEKKDTVITTPLVQYIKEKKANKSKESSSKSSKHSKLDKDGKTEKVQAKKLLQRTDKDSSQSGSAEKAEKKGKADKATKEAVKAATKAASVSKQNTKSSGAQSSPRETSQSASTTERKRERGNVAAAAKILQRDLGLAPSGGRRKGGKATAAAESDTSKNEQTEAGKKETSAKPSKGTGSSQNAKGKGQIAQPIETTSSQGQPGIKASPAPPSQGKLSKSTKGKQASTAPNPTATQAFLKHANPSQGVTEPLLETAFSPFGKILKAEIDKKKGFGYIDFAEPDGLQKAIAASPVSVAQSQVVVLERKANPGGEKGRGKGRTDTQTSPSAGGGNNNNSRGGSKTGEGGAGSSRGSRGGRAKNKSGTKGGGNGSASTEAKTTTTAEVK